MRGKQQKLNREEAKIKRKSALFLAPSIIGVSLFFVLPFLVVIFYSVVNNPIQSTPYIMKHIFLTFAKLYRLRQSASVRIYFVHNLIIIL